jgi:MSHA biogenesis protein MshK
MAPLVNLVMQAAWGVLRAFPFLACVLALPVSAQSLPDPTRPSASQVVAQSDPGTVGGSNGGAPKLQSVLISPQRKEATISGHIVRLGEKFGAAVLVKVTETEAVLRTGSEVQVLKLFPNLEKRSKPTPKPKAHARGNTVKEQ